MDDFYLEQLKLMDDDYVRKEFKENPFSIDGKIDFLQRELRIMTRARTEWSKKPIVKDETIEAYKVELEYWKNMRDQPNNHESTNSPKVSRPDKVKKESLIWEKKKADGTIERISLKNKTERDRAIQERFEELQKENPDWKDTAIDGEVGMEFHLSESQIYKIRREK